MQAKDKFLEKINIIILILILCLSYNTNAKNIYEKIYKYNEALKNSTVNFIQTNDNYLQEGIIFFGDERIKITYKKPQKITIIISEKKGIYINHELEESQFFATKNTHIKFIFDVFHKKKYLEGLTINKSNYEIEINEEIKLENVLYSVKLVYENEPINLRRLEIISSDEKTQMGFFNHRQEEKFNKKLFSMIDPYIEN